MGVKGGGVLFALWLLQLARSRLNMSHTLGWGPQEGGHSRKSLMLSRQPTLLVQEALAWEAIWKHYDFAVLQCMHYDVKNCVTSEVA